MGYYDTLRPDVAKGGVVFPRTDFEAGTETVVAASVLFRVDSADLSISKLPDLPSDFDPGPGEFSPEPGDILELTDFACDYDNYFDDAQYEVCDVVGLIDYYVPSDFFLP